MADFPFEIVGFDLDGTLLDTSPDLAAAVNQALALGGRPPLSETRVRTMIGGGAKRMLELGLKATGGYEAEEFRRLYRALLEFYEANIAVGTVAFPGVMAAIAELDARGVKVAIVTNKFESLAEKLLIELGLRDRFAALIGGDTMGKGKSKPHRAPIDEMIRRCGGGRAAFVGDSVYDVMAAKNAGIPAVVVSFGFLTHPVEELEADAVIDDYADLIGTLEGLA